MKPSNKALLATFLTVALPSLYAFLCYQFGTIIILKITYGSFVSIFFLGFFYIIIRMEIERWMGGNLELKALWIMIAILFGLGGLIVISNLYGQMATVTVLVIIGFMLLTSWIYCMYRNFFESKSR